MTMKSPLYLLLTLCAALLAAPHAAAQTWRTGKSKTAQTYFPPAVFNELYNGESVVLPGWYAAEMQQIHEELRERLSPGDFLEILKVEKDLFGTYSTQAAYQRAVRYLLPSNNPAEYLRKLEAMQNRLSWILQESENAQAFSRAHFLTETPQGIFFRADLRSSGEEVVRDLSDGRFIISKRAPLSAYDVPIWNFWDARTCQLRARFACPMEPTRMLRGEVDNRPVYYLEQLPRDVDEADMLPHDWLNRLLAVCAIDPLRRDFQAVADKQPLTAAKLEAAKRSIPGRLWQTLRLHENLPSPTTASSIWKPRREDAGLDLLQLLPHSEEFESSLLRANLEGDELSLYDTQGQGWKLNLRSWAATPLTEAPSTARAALAQQAIARSMVPKPKDSANEPLIEKGEDGAIQGLFVDGVSEEGDALFRAGDTLFVSAGGTSASGAIVGLYKSDDGVLLFPQAIPFPERGMMRRYVESVDIIPGNGRVSGCIKEDFEFSRLPRLHHLATRRSADERFMELELAMELSHGKEVLRHVTLETANYTFHTMRQWSFLKRQLPPVWVPERLWLLRPESDHHYSIMQQVNINTERKIAELYVDRKRGFAVVLPNGHYAGSPGCEELLGIREGDTTVGLSALAPWRYRPVEVLETLGDARKADLDALREATRQRLEEWGFDPNNMPTEPALGDLPVVEVTLPPLVCPEPKAHLTLTLKARKNDLTRLILRANGEETPVSVEPISAGQEKELSLDIPLKKGQTWVELTAADAEGLRSDTTRFRVLYRGEQQPNLYPDRAQKPEAEPAAAEPTASAPESLSGKTLVFSYEATLYREGSTAEGNAPAWGDWVEADLSKAKLWMPHTAPRELTFWKDTATLRGPSRRSYRLVCTYRAEGGPTATIRRDLTFKPGRVDEASGIYTLTFETPTSGTATWTGCASGEQAFECRNIKFIIK